MLLLSGEDQAVYRYQSNVRPFIDDFCVAADKQVSIGDAAISCVVVDLPYLLSFALWDVLVPSPAEI